MDFEALMQTSDPSPEQAPTAIAAAPGVATGRLVANAAMLGSMVVLVKLVAFGKDWLVAQRFGASDEVDAFLVALVLPSYAIVVAQSFALAFVPTYIRVWHGSGAAAALRLTRGVLGCAAAALVLTTIVLVPLAPLLLRLIAAGFDDEKLALTLRLLYVLAPTILVAGFSSVFASLLNAHERFRAAALAPLALPAFTLVLFWLGRERYGIYALAVGTLVGFAAEFVILGLAAHRQRLLAWPTLQADENARRVGIQYVPVALASLLMSSSMVIDQSMAATLASGSVATLSYGNKMVSLLLGIVAASLSTVLFPRFSKLIAAGRWDELKQLLRTFGQLIFALAIPAVVLLIVGSEPLVRLVFERGAFTSADTIAAAGVQRWLAPEIPFYILVMVGSRLLSALDAYQVTLRIGVLNLVLNVVGNYVFMSLFGVKGIAMSTSLVYVAATVVTLVAIRFKLAERSETPAATFDSVSP
ncbi:MAG TPA: lipid II flippase MurJ [Pirellulales bacterium]|nr:lipid II flippase MurJ [Pirellulales bacterium]